MRVLLLEDNQNLIELILETLEDSCYTIDVYTDGKKALENIFNGYDCFILDINVPSVDGLTLLKEIRSLDTKTPAIIISSNIDKETVEKAYVQGCHDYLKKPFYMYELEKKLEFLCRPKERVVLVDGFVFDLKLGKLFDNQGAEVSLTKKEILLMELLSSKENQYVSFSEIEIHVWQGDLTSTENIRTLIKRIRKKLPHDAILSKPGIGYSLVVISS